jgi:oligoendopeptidase F
MTTAVGDIRWDLTNIYPSPAGVDADLTEAARAAAAFAARYRGAVAGLAPAPLAAAVEALEAIQLRVERAGTYAYLHFCTDTGDPERGALLQEVEERSTAIGTELLFFELEWAAVPDGTAAAVLAQPELDRWRHFLESARRFTPHLLSEPEEKLMAEKAVTGRGAWVRLFTQVTDTITATIDGQDVTLEEALSLLHDPALEVRHAAGAAVTAALEPGLAVRTFIFNTLLADHALDDRVRDYRSWVGSRNLANEIEDDTVEALVSAVVGRYGLCARWYRLKSRLIGLDELTEHDRYAPLRPDEREIPWDEARSIVLDAYRSFSPDMARIATGFFDGYVDAPTHPGKQGGAFAHPAVPGVHPYVLVNYTARRRDVMTLAHELGHGVHQVLAADRGLFNASTPLTLAETASIFGETVTFGRLLSEETEPAARLALLAGRIEDTFATVFRQVAMNRFEDSVHNARRDGGELSPAAIAEAWLRTQRAMFGDSVRLSDDYGSWWSYIPHFVHTPGYVYAYAFGNLLALAIYARYESDGAAFVPAYLELLAAGGSDRPERLAGIVGVDLTDPGFWDRGLDVIEAMVAEAEALAQ